MRDTLAEWLTSKKVITTIVAILVTIGARAGLNLDSELTGEIVGLFGLLLLGQGLADHGKAAALIHAASPSILASVSAPVTAVIETAPPPAGGTP